MRNQHDAVELEVLTVDRVPESVKREALDYYVRRFWAGHEETQIEVLDAFLNRHLYERAEGE